MLFTLEHGDSNETRGDMPWEARVKHGKFRGSTLSIRIKGFSTNQFNKSYDLPLDLLQYQRENSAEYLYS